MSGKPGRSGDNQFATEDQAALLFADQYADRLRFYLTAAAPATRVLSSVSLGHRHRQERILVAGLKPDLRSKLHCALPCAERAGPTSDTRC